MANICRIGNGAGFLGDNLDAPRRLAESGQLDYLTLEYLAELTLSILARLRQKDPAAGYAADFLDVLASLLPELKKQPRLRIVTNAGGMNPTSCAKAASRILSQRGLGDCAVGVVEGDDLLPRLDDLVETGVDFANLDTQAPLSSIRPRIVSANAYLGAEPIAQALARQARIVITGRVADASLTVGPAMHEFGWAWDDLQSLAGATIAGHLIECGAQVSGGLYRHWQELGLASVGYPIAELSSDGALIITKPSGTGGAVTRETVAEQLVYEIGDPAHYLTPDVDVDFTMLEVDDLGKDRVAVRGARGGPAPEKYKVSIAYEDGFMASGQLLVYGGDCLQKARACGEMILARVTQAGFSLADSLVEILGRADSVPGVGRPIKQAREVVLRVSARDSRQDAIERFTKEFAPLITSGPPGLAGYAAGRSTVRPVLAYWPALVPKELLTPSVEVRSALQWLQERKPNL